MTTNNTVTAKRAAQTRRTLTMFSFGYWGNGRDVPSLVRAVQAGERDRGYAPPLWVDIRLSRSVRAEGFRSDLLERRLRDRYAWMQDLGNERIASGEGGIRIRRPAAAEELLDRALAMKKQRVIFFCACEWACNCHRRTVSKLLVRRARLRDVRLRVIEWPGGEPGEIDVRVGRAELGKLTRGELGRLHVPANVAAKAAAVMPWGSVAHLHADDDEGFAILGPARFGTYGPYFPVLEGLTRPPSAERCQRVRKRLGADPLVSF